MSNAAAKRNDGFSHVNAGVEIPKSNKTMSETAAFSLCLPPFGQEKLAIDDGGGYGFLKLWRMHLR